MGLDAAGQGTRQPEAAMRSVAVVVLRELSQHRPQVALVEHDQVIETFGPDGPNDSLAQGVGIWRPWRRPHADDAQTGQLTVKVPAIDSIPVVDEKPRLPAPGRCFQELLPDPGSGRTRGDVEVEQLSPLVATEKEDLEGPEGQGLDDEQVAAQMPRSWFDRNVRQRWLPTGLGFCQRYRRMDRLLTTMPSFNSSPRMRSAPQRGFSCEIRAMSSRTSALR